MENHENEGEKYRPGQIRNLQKLCDSADWFDERVDYIIRNNLRSQPTFHRKQWEFAMLFLALSEEGVLNEEATGIAFGAGVERLAYSVCEKVKKLIATDLYAHSSNWVGAKTNDPKQFLLANAPFPIDSDRLDAVYMDMRSIEYPDNTFDFCYSSCAFEHIAEEDAGFIEHLQEVNRTLKEGGTYAITTELTYGAETVRVPHNYLFEINHLLDLVQQSGLHAQPIFDGKLIKNSLNEPMPLLQDFGLHYGKYWVPHITLLRQGRIFTSCMLVLKKESSKLPNRPRVEEFGQSKAFVKDALARQLKNMWQDWQYISPTRGAAEKSTGIIGHEEFLHQVHRAKNDLVFHSPYVLFGQGFIEIKIDISPASIESLNIKLVALDTTLHKREIIAEEKVKFKDLNKKTIILRFSAEPEKAYAVLGRGPGFFQSIIIHTRKN